MAGHSRTGICCGIALCVGLLAVVTPAAARTGPVQLGTAVNNGGFAGIDARYRATLAGYEAVTAESVMKIEELEPERGRFEFARADAIVNHALAGGQQVHGHTLTWCEDTWLPSWLRDGDWTREELLEVLDEYITAVLGHFRGRVPTWDVVNEAITDAGGWRDCLWSRVIGDDWVEQAFRIARRVDPTVRLFYNEVRVDRPNAKYERMVEMLADFRARGVPVDGAGSQMHLVRDAPAQGPIEEVFRRLGELGLEAHISEMDLPVWYLGSGIDTKFARQAESYRRVAAACQAQPACFRITTWGFTDAYTWRGAGSMPLPFDTEYRPKPAWTALHEVLRPPPAQPVPAAPPTPAAPSPPPPPAGRAANSGSPPALAARLRRQRRSTLLRRRLLVVALHLQSAQAAHVELVARVRGRVIGTAATELAGGGTAVVTLQIGAEGRRLLRRAERARVVVVATATDAEGRSARVRTRASVR